MLAYDTASLTITISNHLLSFCNYLCKNMHTKIASLQAATSALSLITHFNNNVSQFVTTISFLQHPITDGHSGNGHPTSTL